MDYFHKDLDSGMLDQYMVEDKCICMILQS